jgi:DNA-binding GntR family transcriptional regulator
MTGIIVRNLPEQLVDLLRDRILTGQFTSDQSIRQDALAAELGVSKIPLREALTRLEQEGLVRSHANRGYFVSGLDPDEAEEVFALRLKLEPEAAALACRRATEQDRDVATRTLAMLDQATLDRDDGVGALNRAFHMALIRPSGQIITTNLLQRLHVLGDRYVRKHLEPLGRNDRAVDEHAQLLNTWLLRDTKNVTKLLSKHIRAAMVDLRTQLSSG